MSEAALDDEVFAPDPLELRLWTEEVNYAREDYYRSPSTPLSSWRSTSDRYPLPRRISASQAHADLERALQDLWSANHTIAHLRRVITAQARRINELEERDDGEHLHRVREHDSCDGSEGDRALFTDLRGSIPGRDKA